MRTCGTAHAGRTSCWVVVHNESTDHYICGPERSSDERAVRDVRLMCDWIGPRQFARLSKDDVVTFHIHRWDADDREDPDRGFVWSWTWDEAGAVPSAE